MDELLKDLEGLLKEVHPLGDDAHLDHLLVEFMDGDMFGVVAKSATGEEAGE